MKIYQRTWFIILMLIALPPIGIVLMWTGKKFNKIIRIILTVFFGFVTLFDILLFTIDSDETTSIPETTNNTSVSTTESTSDNTTPAANTTAMVDYICSEAKKKAQNATDADEQEAIKYLSDNIDTCFSSNEVMEKFMYYGALLNYMYDDTDSRSKLGFTALKTVKYVYRGVEKVSDETTKDNLQKTKELLAETTSSESTSKTTTKITTTEKKTTTTEKSTAAPTTTKKQTTTQNAPEGDSRTIYVTPTGKRYHFDPDCGGKNSHSATLDYAISLGLTPCQKCAS